MVGERAMRGMMMAVHRMVANAFVPVATPIVLLRLDETSRLAKGDTGSIKPEHSRYRDYQNELLKVTSMQYARFLNGRDI
jgi:hypothetical protein